MGYITHDEEESGGRGWVAVGYFRVVALKGQFIIGVVQQH